MHINHLLGGNGKVYIQGVTNIRSPVYYLSYFQPSTRSRNTSNKPDVKGFSGSVFLHCLYSVWTPPHLSVLSSLWESQPAVAICCEVHSYLG